MIENKSIHPNGRVAAKMQRAGKENLTKIEKIKKHRDYLASVGFTRKGRK